MPDQRPILRIEPGMHTAPIVRIGVDATCTLMVTGSVDKTARLWALPEGGRGSARQLRTLRVPIGDDNEGKIYSVALAPNGKWVAAGGQTHAVYIFDAATGLLLKRIGGLGNVIKHLAFSPDGSRLAATLGAGQGMRMWETGSWTLLAEDRNYGSKPSYGAAFDGANRLYTVSYDGQVRRYDREGHLEASAGTQGGKEPYSVALHPSGVKLAIGFNDTTVVEIYGARTLNRLYTADTSGVNGNNLNSVAWSANGSQLYAGGNWRTNPQKVIIWGEEGRGERSEAPISLTTITQLLPCSGGIAVGAADPAFGLIEANGQKQVWQEGVTGDMRDKLRDAFTLSFDGKRVRFGLAFGGKDPVLFDLASFSLSNAPARSGPPSAENLGSRRRRLAK